MLWQMRNEIQFLNKDGGRPLTYKIHKNATESMTCTFPGHKQWIVFYSLRMVEGSLYPKQKAQKCHRINDWFFSGIQTMDCLLQYVLYSLWYMLSSSTCLAVEELISISL
jgi:hypothetical protein